MTITISIAVSILLAASAIIVALEEGTTRDLLQQARVEWVNFRRRIRLPEQKRHRPT